MNFAPIIIPTLNRYSHFKDCIESLSKNKYASETELYVGLDFPPAHKYEDGWKKISDYISTITGFKKVTVIRRDKNWGAIENIKDLLKIVLEDHESFIFSEDDNIFSTCFLEFINTGLEKYKNDKSILAIEGYSYPIKMPESNANCVKIQRYFSDWGMAMWKDRYEEERDTICQSYFDSILKSKKKSDTLKRKSRKNYIYAFGLCSPAPAKKIRPMDYTSSIYQCVENLYSIMPKESLVKNCGWDNSGINCQTDKEDDETVKLFDNQQLSQKINFDDLIIHENETELINKKLDESIIGHYDKRYYSKVCIKGFFFRLGILNFIRKILRKNNENI